MPPSTTTRRWILHLLAGLLAALAIWLPAPFGSVHLWAHAVLRIAAAVLLAVALLARSRWPREVGLAAAALAGIAGLGLLQSLPLPAGLAGLLSPHHAAQTRAASDDAAVALSLAPEQSRGFALTWGAVAACGLAAGVAGRRRWGRRIVGGSLVAAALFQIVVGARSWMGDGRLWGREVAGTSGRLRGTFVNPDHFALYLEIVLPVVLVAGWWCLRRVKREPLEFKVLVAGPPVLVWLLLFVALAFSGSRAGLVAGIFAAVLQGVLIAASARHWKPGVSGLLAAAMGLLAVAFIGVQEGLGRWLATSAYELTWNVRLEVYSRTVAIWERFPLLGSGLATFREAFPAVQLSTSPGTWWHAHNDYLELLATTGLAGAALMLAVLYWVVKGLLRALRDGQRTEDRCAAVAALGVLAAVAIHSLFDFGLTMPANAATLAILCGLGIAAAEQETPVTPATTRP
ncbi:MAG TPA: O-antigen ligase family protein [Thermoanaerobaculaceae bacterium]|nr:O-antigen ligase family protein [Thermoanaerobaculaceae bacterium]HRS16659.1 O-antigen ligase family protein [Thermoanaerobaculaceae bacterium]